MYAVVNHLHLTKPVDEFRAGVEEELRPLLLGSPGFKDFYFVKVAEDRAIAIIIWQDAASADAGAEQFGPGWFHNNVAPYLASEQQRSTGEIIVQSKP
jgi:heme-degrading monooxygenase HmoA